MTVKNLEFILTKSTWPMEKTFSAFGLLKQKNRKKSATFYLFLQEHINQLLFRGKPNTLK